MTGGANEDDVLGWAFLVDLSKSILSSRTQLKMAKMMKARDRASFGDEDDPTTVRYFLNVLSKYTISIDMIS